MGISSNVLSTVSYIVDGSECETGSYWTSEFQLEFEGSDCNNPLGRPTASEWRP